MTDLVLHLGVVHRSLAWLIGERMQRPPQASDRSYLELASDWHDWLPPGHAPQPSPVPAALLGWFHAGAARLAAQFRAADSAERVWTWSVEQSVGFWQRMQAIEAAVHRWDAENAVGTAAPIDAELAADAVGQTFEVMVPARRARAKAPPGRGERYVFERTDGPGRWAVRFDGDSVLLGPPGDHYDVHLSGTSSDLALFLWQRPVAGKLVVRGDTSMVSRYFALVPPG